MTVPLATSDSQRAGAAPGSQAKETGAKPGTPTISATKPAPKPAASQSYKTYRIRKGDTLTGIAQKTGTTVAKLEKANPGLNPRRLIPGKTIRLP